MTLDYAQNLTLRVSDDGAGIDDAVLQAGKEGHFGLVGMRERAERVGAKLLISSVPLGTEITLIVPGAVAFYKRRGLVAIFNTFGRPHLIPGLGVRT